MSTTTSTVCAFADIESGTARKFVVSGVPVAVVRIDDEVYAVNDICSHANVSLSGGEVWCAERELECPKHSSTFSLTTGEPTTLPATQPIAVYEASVVDGHIMVTIDTGGDE
ncbi:MAG: Rieske 2Fe-2S domain-containing protein [Ilumatobacteraceae bacterium]